MDDIAAVTRIIVAYGLHIDARRWDEFAALFASEVWVDFTAVAGGEPGDVRAADLVAGRAAVLSGCTSTHHLILRFLPFYRIRLQDVYTEK